MTPRKGPLTFNSARLTTLLRANWSLVNGVWVVRCPECGTDVARLPPCRVCSNQGLMRRCCLCAHTDPEEE